jgi:hypothetical protein
VTHRFAPIARLRRRPALWAAIGMFLVCGVLLTAVHADRPLPLGARAAIAAVRHDHASQVRLRGARWDNVTVSRVDGTLDRVRLALGSRVLADFAVDRAGAVVRGMDYRSQVVPYGSTIAYEPAVLGGLTLLFVLMAGVMPLRRLRNLDVLAAVSLLAPVILLQYRYLDASVVASLPSLLYLLGRCTWAGLGPRRPGAPATPLLTWLTRDWEASRRVRLMGIGLVALSLVVLMVGISSTRPVDVSYAVMEGATNLIHGVLPYGHMPGDVLHGDTYPILSYAAYAPLALVAPVSSMWDSVDGALTVAAMSALLAAAVLYRHAAGPRRRARRSPQEQEAGLRAAIVWLSFPPLLIVVSTGTTDVVLAVIILFAVLLWRRPAASSGLLAVAAWFKLAPAALVPMWLAPLRGRQLVAAIAAMTAVSAAMLAVLIGVGGLAGVPAMVHAVAYQFSRGSPQSGWSALGIEWLQPIGQAAVLALIAAVTVRMFRDRTLSSDRTRVAAIAAGVLIGLQLSSDYWAFLYVVWVVPLLATSVLGEPATMRVERAETFTVGPGEPVPVPA